MALLVDDGELCRRRAEAGVGRDREVTSGVLSRGRVRLDGVTETGPTGLHDRHLGPIKRQRCHQRRCIAAKNATWRAWSDFF